MAIGQIGYTEGGPTKLFTEVVQVSPGVEANMERVVQSPGVLASVGDPTLISATGRTAVTKDVFAMRDIVLSARAVVPEDSEAVIRVLFFDATGEIICISTSESMYFSDIIDGNGKTISEPVVFTNNVGASSVEVVVESLPVGTPISLYVNAV